MLQLMEGGGVVIVEVHRLPDDIEHIAVVERDEEKQATRVRNLNREELKDWLAYYSTSELWDKNVLGGRPV